MQILLATYNGERFLREQIDSLLAQTYKPLTVLARDDGSRDQTAAILEDYATRFPERFAVLPFDVPSGGAMQNFARLLRASTAPYVAFADQDDVWLPDKIALEMQAMQRLEEAHSADTPLLVFTDLEIVNDDLTQRAPSFWKHQRLDPMQVGRFRRLMMQNVVTGCTMLINRPLAALSQDMPRNAYMHDWWIALLTNAFGAFAVVREPTVLYRQHGGNLLGAQEHGRPNLVPRWRYHEKRREQWEMIAHLAEALLHTFRGRLGAEREDLLGTMVRIEHSERALFRVFACIRERFFFSHTLRGNLALLWYLLDMNYSKRTQPAKPRYE